MNSEVPPSSSSNLDLKAGTLIAGRFEICARIGSGGMGMVYRSIDKELGDDVALKLLHPHLAEDETVFRRFRNEVLVARSLSHPNIVRTHDIGRAEDGFSYISMELVDGLSLKEYLVSRTGSHQEGGERSLIPFKEAMSVFCQVLSGINYAHGKGVIHRDLKPANVMIDRAGEVKLADFGTARILGMDTSITRTGQLIGTPDYMSPEQIRGEKLDQACDLYSLGIIAYELVTGTRPFAADTAVAVAFKHLNDPIPCVKDIAPETPEWFQQMVDKAAAKSREDRFSSVADLGGFLGEKMTEMGIAPGFFAIDGTHFLSQSTSGINARPSTLETDKTALASDSLVDGSASSAPGKSSSFKLGDPESAKRAETWTLEMPQEELLPEESPAAKQSKTEKNLQKKNSSLGIYLVLFLFLVGGLGLAFWPNSPLNLADRFQSIEQEPEVVPEQTEREKLHSELLDFALDSEVVENASDNDPGDKEKEAEKTKESKETKEFVKVNSTNPKLKKEAVDKSKASNKTSAQNDADSKSSVPQQTPSVDPRAAQEDTVEFKEAKKEVVVEQTPVPLVYKPVSGVLILEQSGQRLPSGKSLMADRLRDVSWKANLRGLTAERLKMEKKVLNDVIRLNVYEPKQSKVITKLRPGSVKLAKAMDGLTMVLGNLGNISRKKPQAGDYRLDLIYDGEVLDSQAVSLSVARVSFSRPSNSANSRAGTGGRVAIVRGPTYREAENNTSVRNTKPASSQQKNEPSVSPDQVLQDNASPDLAEARIEQPAVGQSAESASRQGARFVEQEIAIDPQTSVGGAQVNRPSGNLGYESQVIPPGTSSALPPARTTRDDKNGAGLRVVQPGVSSATAGSLTQSPPVRVAGDTYSGTLNFAAEIGGPSEQRRLSLNLRFSGNDISGSAKVTGLNPFRVKGRVLPRGIELILSGREVSLRLTAVRRDRLLRGTYVISGSTQRGSWQATQNN